MWSAWIKIDRSNTQDYVLVRCKDSLTDISLYSSDFQTIVTAIQKWLNWPKANKMMSHRDLMNVCFSYIYIHTHFFSPHSVIFNMKGISQTLLGFRPIIDQWWPGQLSKEVWCWNTWTFWWTLIIGNTSWHA